MEIESWIETVSRSRVIAVIRTPQVELGYQMAQAVAKGGIRLIEITWNSDRPADLIGKLRADLPTCAIGAGTLLTQADLQTAIAVGAQFLFSPHSDPVMIHLALTQNIPMIPGALSPTEIVQAWQAGASSVKVFPVQAVGGAAYIRSLQGPLGTIPLIPTGGVTVENSHLFLEAGAIAVGISSSLFPQPAVLNQNWEMITSQAQHLLQQIQIFLGNPEQAEVRWNKDRV